MLIILIGHYGKDSWRKENLIMAHSLEVKPPWQGHEATNIALHQ